MWSLDLAPLLNADSKSVWERVARKGQSPSERSGAVMTPYRNRGVTFGGVYDGNSLTEKQVAYDGVKKEKRVPALFFNELHTFDIENKRWFELPVLGKKTSTVVRRRKKNKASDGAADDEGDEDDLVEDEVVERMGISSGNSEEPWLANGAIFSYSNKVSGRDHSVEPEASIAEGFEWMLEDGDERPWWGGGAKERAWYAGDPWVLSANPEAEAMPASVADVQMRSPLIPLSPTQLSIGSTVSDYLGPTPLGRLNPSLLLLGHTLVVYGGTFESENREWALDDAWSIDLRDREGWKCIIHGTPHDFDSADKGDSDGSSSDEDGVDSSGDEDSDNEGAKKNTAADSESGDEETLIVETKFSAVSTADENESTISKKLTAMSVQDEIAELQDSLEIDNASITPASGEALRDFFARTVRHAALRCVLLSSTLIVFCFPLQGSHWNAAAYAANTLPPELFDVKVLRREAFALAEVRYEFLRPILARLDALEKEQLESEGAGGDDTAACGTDCRKAKTGAKGPAKPSPKKKKPVASARLPAGSRPPEK